MQVDARPEGPEPHQELIGIALGTSQRKVEGTKLDAATVRPDQERSRLSGNLIGQSTLDHLAGQCLDAHFLLSAALESGQGSGHRLCGRRAKAPSTLSLKMDGRSEQPQQHGRGLRSRGAGTEIVGRQVDEAEFFGRRTVPQEPDIQCLGDRTGVIHQPRGCRRIETQQDVRRLDLRAASGREFDLQTGARIGQNRSSLEVTVFLKKYLIQSESCDWRAGGRSLGVPQPYIMMPPETSMTAPLM